MILKRGGNNENSHSEDYARMLFRTIKSDTTPDFSKELPKNTLWRVYRQKEGVYFACKESGENHQISTGLDEMIEARKHMDIKVSDGQFVIPFIPNRETYYSFDGKTYRRISHALCLMEEQPVYFRCGNNLRFVLELKRPRQGMLF